MDELKIIQGGEHVSVTTLSGEKVSVFVRTLPIADLDKYQMCMDREDLAVELFTNQERGWAETITRQSLEAVLSKGEELNLPFFTTWLRRKLERNEKVAAGVGQQMAKQLAAVADILKAASNSHSEGSSPS